MKQRGHDRARRAGAGIAILLSLFVAGIAWSAQRVGLTVTVDEPVAEDLYAAGRHIDILAPVDGDAAVAGQRVVFRERVSGDVLAAGERVLIEGPVGDDVRAAGARLAITAPVADHVVAAGGNIRIGPTARIGGWAWLAGESVRIDGEIQKDLKVAAREVIITGSVRGNVDVTAETVEVRADAHITGDLTWRSEHEPTISDEARVDGQIIRGPAPVEIEEPRFQPTFGGLLPVLAMMVTGIALYLLFPGFSVRAATAVHGEPFKSLGLGLAVLAATPLVVVGLLLTAVGAVLAFALLALYLLALLGGWLVGALALSEGALRVAGRQDSASKGLRVAGIVIALAVLALVKLIPYLGGLVVFVVLVLGLGALGLATFRAYWH